MFLLCFRNARGMDRSFQPLTTFERDCSVIKWSDRKSILYSLAFTDRLLSLYLRLRKLIRNIITSAFLASQLEEVTQRGAGVGFVLVWVAYTDYGGE